jgi:ABC-type antimicrobial peptide transport system permease subunit
MDLFRHYTTVAVRQIVNHKAFSVLNVLGLALGLTCSLLIFLWVREEVSMDRYHRNGPDLYRVMSRFYYDGSRDLGPPTAGLLAGELKRNFPDIIRASGYRLKYATFEAGGKINKEQGAWVSNDWLNMFTVPLLVGSAQTALQMPNGVALSRKLAVHYFGSPQAAVGKTLRVDNADDFIVTSVFEDLPGNTSLKYDFLFPWEGLLQRATWLKNWMNNSPETYLQLRPGADVAAVNAKIKHFLRGINPNIDLQHLDRFDIELLLQPYQDMYLHSGTENGELSGGQITYVRLFSIVAVALLVIAAINFMNLATARSAKRAREVGIRKVVGAGRSLLVGQFLGEALLLTAFAVVVALCLVQGLLPAFNGLTGKQMALPLTAPDFWLALLGMMAGTGLLAGSYPALFLASLQPVRVLKGTLKFRPGARLFRQALVVVQFVISMLLIIGTFVVYRQIDYMQTKNLGFDRENLIYVPLEGELGPKYETLKQELGRRPGIGAVTRMDSKPNEIGGNTHSVDWKGKDPTVNVMFTPAAGHYGMVEVLKLQLLAGRAFSPAFPTDSTNYLINEQAARRLGYAQPVGQPLTLWDKPGTIIGVVRDFHFQSLHQPIQPLIIRFGKDWELGTLLVRTRPGQTRQALASLESLCKQLNPKFPFSYSFGDEQYDQLYRSEQVVSALANYFTGLAVFIACLGLFGLASFMAEQRTKEIGVRKVLGASVGAIIGLLSKEFVKLVVLAILIASPAAWWLARKWLENYEYRVPLGVGIFVGAGLLALLITLATVSYQSIKAALANPVNSLRSE